MKLLISVAMMIAVCLSYHYVIVSSIGEIVEPLCSSPIVCGQESEGHWFWTIVTSVSQTTVLLAIQRGPRAATASCSSILY
jgi:hypothetical protein